MTTPAREILLTPTPLPRRRRSFRRTAGGVVDFYGVVRGHGGRGSHHAASTTRRTWKWRGTNSNSSWTKPPEQFPVLGVILHHRIGFVRGGGSLAVSAGERGAPGTGVRGGAMAGRTELKQRVPIWKHPVSRATATA